MTREGAWLRMPCGGYVMLRTRSLSFPCHSAEAQPFLHCHSEEAKPTKNLGGRRKRHRSHTLIRSYSTLSPFHEDPSGASNRGDRGSVERRGAQRHKVVETVRLVVRVAARGVKSCHLARLLAENVKFRPFLGVKPKLSPSDISILVGLPGSAIPHGSTPITGAALTLSKLAWEAFQREFAPIDQDEGETASNLS